MLNDKQFRERASRELRELGKQTVGMVTDRELYRKMEDELQSNPALSGNGNAFVDMVRGSYIDAMTMRLRRLLASEANLSLRRVIVQLAEYSDLLHQKVASREVAEDAAELDKLATYLKQNVEPHFSGHERTPGALAATQRELDHALDRFIELLKKYYWVVCDGYLEVEPKYVGDALAAFRQIR